MEVNLNEHTEIWDKFVESSPQRNIFVYSKFIDSLNIPYHLVTCYDKGRISAGSIIYYSELGDSLTSNFAFTQYQGIILADNSYKKPHSKISFEFKVVEFIIQKMVEQYGQFCSCQSWRFADMRPFQWYNYHEPHKGIFKINLRYTGILDLARYSGFATYWPTIRKVRRQEYNKAQKTFEIVTSADEIILDDLHAKTFKRQGLERSQEESSLLRSITRHAITHNYGTLKMARLDGEVASAILYLFDDRTVYYLFGANHPDYRKTGSGTLLVGEMIKDAFAKGLQEVDFVGVNSPNRGDFKTSFNAEIKPYFVASIG